MIRSPPVMDALYRCLLRPLLFRLDPETAHAAALRALPFLPDREVPTGPRLSSTVAGLEFPNPIGLAAGFDKDGSRAHFLSRLGFGHAEIGTVTPKPQPGNPKPRLFRIPEKEALLNRMGFNNPGAERAASTLAFRLAESPRRIPIGVSIGKQRETEIDEAAGDYLAAAAAVLPVADFLVANISSPNTPGLRSLEDPERLGPLLIAVRREVEEGARTLGIRRPPLFVKLSPDLSDGALEEAAGAAGEAGFDGIVLTNTTADPSLLEALRLGEGGVSGRPVAARALEAVRIAGRATGGKLLLIATGGVFGGEDAYRRIRAGASLVQVYTALVYEGPGFVRAALRRLEELLVRDGFANVAEAVGSE
ncbi:MAG: quinone-dependent dihydroorotate dehydrogenase [Candidatus Eisenbacteria bacterium]